jgi:quercetin dioxygenase-like cupin family protein
MKQLIIGSWILLLVSAMPAMKVPSPFSAIAADKIGIGNGKLIAQDTIPPTSAQQSGIKRTDLQRYDLSARGREVIQVRVDFTPGSAFGKHSHPGEEIIYVIEGVFEYEVEGKPPVTLRAGDVLFIPDGTVHAAKNIGNTNAAELATYVVRKGKPLLVMTR